MRLEDHVAALVACGRLLINAQTGQVFSRTSNSPYRPLGARTTKGYLRICMTLDGQQYHGLAHRVVWVSIHGPIPHGMQIDHLNSRKTDNRLCNLELVTAAENMARAAKNGLTNGGWRNGPRDPVNGQFLGKAAAGRLLDGREWNEMPEDTQ